MYMCIRIYLLSMYVYVCMHMYLYTYIYIHVHRPQVFRWPDFLSAPVANVCPRLRVAFQKWMQNFRMHWPICNIRLIAGLPKVDGFAASPHCSEPSQSVFGVLIASNWIGQKNVAESMCFKLWLSFWTRFRLVAVHPCRSWTYTHTTTARNVG